MAKKDINVMVVGYNRATQTTELLNIDQNGTLSVGGSESSEPINIITTGIDVPDSPPVVGQSVIAVTGTAIRLSAVSVPLPGSVVLVRCDSENAGPITVGGSTVTNDIDGTGNGIIVRPGDIVPVFASDLNQVYVNGTATYVFSWTAG